MHGSPNVPHEDGNYTTCAGTKIFGHHKTYMYMYFEIILKPFGTVTRLTSLKYYI